MNIVDLIIKKRDKQEFTENEIKFFVKSVVDESIKDYQITALLMAIFLNGMTKKETALLALEMAESGSVLCLDEIPGIKVDKHSTGGVADTTTLILAPLVASLGVKVIKMSGRGLGHTGGTLDKLESIPNFNINIKTTDAIEFAKSSNIVIMGQTENLTPADSKLYALRDVTGTVDSIPLIAASIMSKKIAAGTDVIVLDVKCGSGAFMKNLDEARKLAVEMVDIGKSINRKVVAVISGMEQPLGMNIGNSLEVIEAIEVLKGNVKGSLLEVSLLLGAHILKEGEIVHNIDDGKKLLMENINNGKGLAKFRELVKQQNGNEEIVNNYNLLPKSNEKIVVASDKEGFVYSIDCEKIGKAFVETGAGRKTKEDKIDYGAGIIMKVRIGDNVKKGDLLAEIYGKTVEHCNLAKDIVDNAIKICSEKPKDINLVLDVII